MGSAAKRRLGQVWMDLGPAECAVAACFASRKQIRISASADSFVASFNTALARKGLAVLSPQSGTRPAPVPEFRNKYSPQAAKWQQDPLHS